MSSGESSKQNYKPKKMIQVESKTGKGPRWSLLLTNIDELTLSREGWFLQKSQSDASGNKPFKV